MWIHMDTCPKILTEYFIRNTRCEFYNEYRHMTIENLMKINLVSIIPKINFMWIVIVLFHGNERKNKEKKNLLGWSLFIWIVTTLSSPCHMPWKCCLEMLLGNPAKSGGTLGFVLFSFSIIRMTLLWCALAIVSYNVSYMLVIWVALLMIWVLYFLNLQYDVNHIYWIVVFPTAT